MRIQRTLQISAIVSVASILIVAAGIMAMNRMDVQHSSRLEILNNAVRQIVSLRSLLQEFPGTENQRAVSQWQAQLAELAPGLKNLPTFDNESVFLKTRILEECTAVGSLIETLSGPEKDVHERIGGQLSVETASMVVDILNLDGLNDEHISSQRQWLVAVVAGSVAFLAGVVLVLLQILHRRVVAPIVQLEKAAKNFGAGTLDQPIQLKGSDEVSMLAASFEHMRTSLKNRLEDLMEANSRIKQANEKVYTEKQRLEAVMEALPVGVAVLDEHGANMKSNKAFEQIWGEPRPPADSAGDYSLYKAWWADTGEPVKPEQWASSRAVRKGETVVGQVLRIARFDGRSAFVYNGASPIHDAHRGIIGCAVAVMDITGHKRMEEELRASRDELELRVQERTAELKSYMSKLEQSNQALQDFAHIAAHDMKEPLRKVIAFGNMLGQKCGDSLGESGNDYLNRMLNATERMQSLLTGLLDYSRVATASEPFKEVDLSNLICEVLSDLEVRIVKTGGEVHVGTLPVISADPTQMRQLFQNLIGNALKFHKPGEKPVVRVRCVSTTDSRSRIVVEDNGIGFEEQYLEKIFAPFQRLHGKNSQYEGTGMGLAICKKIVERHGGSITATSAPGTGTCFIVRLPMKQSIN